MKIYKSYNKEKNGFQSFSICFKPESNVDDLQLRKFYDTNESHDNYTELVKIINKIIMDK